MKLWDYLIQNKLHTAPSNNLLL